MGILRLESTSSVVDSSANGRISTITLFEPSSATKKLIADLYSGKHFDSVELVDSFDDCAIDTHKNPRPCNYIGQVKGDDRKTHTVRLIFSLL